MIHAFRSRRTWAAVLLCSLMALPTMAQPLDAAPQGHSTWTAVDGSGLCFRTEWRPDGQHFALSRDGGRTVIAEGAYDGRIMLRYARFDPLTDGEPEVPALLRASAGDRLLIVQYATPATVEYREALAATGAEVLHFLPWNAQLVRAAPGTTDRIAALPFVRWAGAYHPAYRIDEQMLMEATSTGLPTRRYHIHVSRKTLEEKQGVATAISRLGGVIEGELSPHGYLMQATLTGAQLLEVVRRPDVLFVDRWSAPEHDMDKARILLGADYVESVGGFRGEGVNGEVMDSGLRTSHLEFQYKPAIINGGNGTSTSHGTSVYGQVFASGLSNPQARGVLPEAQGYFTSYNAFSDRYAHTANLVQNLDVVFQTNSWGDARTLNYTNVSADMDNLLFDHDILITQSQSNAGDQMSRPQAWAKNIVSVGGIRHYDTLTTTDDAWAGGASIGPAADGRIKPDLSAFYDAIFTTSSSSDSSYTTSFGGTSGATPMTGGHFGLLFQMWSAGVFNNPLSGLTVFDNRPHMSTAKALMINFASQYPFTGTTSDLTRVHQGWGRADVARMYDGATDTVIVDETDVLLPFSSTAYPVTVNPSTPELRATLVYSDPPAVPTASIHRINDLSLRVTDPNGTVYWGNNGLLGNNFSTSGGSENNIDTVENVFVQNPLPGTWIVEVIATQINQDGHVETPALDADYGLVIAGVVPQPVQNDVGQPNSADASLRFAGAYTQFGYAPNFGVNGPYFATRTVGQALDFNFRGAPGDVIVLAMGGLQANALVWTGNSLDLGGNFGIVLNGAAPLSFFDQLGQIGAGGTTNLAFPIPSTLPSGVLGTFQAAIFDPADPVNSLLLTGATEITIQ